MRIAKRQAWLCRICGRAARVFDMAPGRPARRTCCDECHRTLNVVIDDLGGQEKMAETLSEMERDAIKSARRSLYDALVAIGRADAFNNATAEEMDSVIRAVWDGVRLSMQQQSDRGVVPW